MKAWRNVKFSFLFGYVQCECNEFTKDIYKSVRDRRHFSSKLFNVRERNHLEKEISKHCLNPLRPNKQEEELYNKFGFRDWWLVIGE